MSQRFLCVALGAALCIQILYLGLFLFGPRYPLPHFAESFIQSKFLDQGYYYQSNNAWIDSGLNLHFEGLEIKSKDSTQLITAHLLVLTPQLMPLFFTGKLKPHRLIIQNASYAEGAQKDKLLQSLNLSVRQSGPWWEIDQCNAYLLGIPTVLDGFIGQKVLASHKPSNQKEKKYFDVHSLVSFLKEGLMHVHKPFLFLRLSASHNAHPVLESSFWAEHLKIPSLLSADTLAIHTQAEYPPEGFHWSNSIELHANNLYLEAPQRVLAKRLDAKISLDISDEARLPPTSFKMLEAHLTHLLLPDYSLPIQSLDCTFSPLGKDSCDGSIILTEGLSWAELSIQLNPNEKFSTILGQGHLEPPFLNKLPKDKLPFLNDFVEKPPLFFRSQLKIEPYLQPEMIRIEECKFALRLGPGCWKSIPFYSISLKGYYQPDLVKIETASFNGPNGQVEGIGSFSQGRSLLAEIWGQADPRVLNPYLPSWWEEIWPPINFSREWPSANLHIQGETEDETKIQVIGLIQGRHFQYKEVNIDFFKTWLDARHHNVCLGPFEAKIAPYEGFGKIHWTFDATHAEPLTTKIQYKGSLPLNALATLPTAKPIVEDFECSTPPYLTLEGTFSLLNPEKDSLNITADCPSSLSYLKVPLDDLHFKATQKGQLIEIEPISFGIAQGQGQGEASVRLSTAHPSQLSLSLSFNGLSRDLLLEENPYLIGLQEALPRPSSTSNLNPPSGLIDAVFNAQGPLDNPLELEGSGFFQLKELQTKSQIASLFSSSPPSNVNLGGFQIQEIVSAFKLNKGFISFQEARLSGPSTRIIVNGSYHIPTETLDLKLKIYPFAELPILSTAFIPLRPFSKVFEVHLTGNLAHPHVDWAHF